MSAPSSGRVALVTGAAGGMGPAHARRLAATGATVAVTDIVASVPLSALATEIGGIAVGADLADPAECARLVGEVAGRLGGLDVLVANHAAMTMAALTDHDPDDWWRVVEVNLGGTFFLIQAALPHLRRRGGGRVVVVTSEWGVTGWPGATAYAASKAGLIALVKTLGRELAPQGVIVNAVAPGVIDTAQLQVDAAAAGVDVETMRRRYAAAIPLGRLGVAEEVAAAVDMLADPQLSAVVGQVISCNGGATRARV